MLAARLHRRARRANDCCVAGGPALAVRGAALGSRSHAGERQSRLSQGLSRTSGDVYRGQSPQVGFRIEAGGSVVADTGLVPRQVPLAPWCSPRVHCRDRAARRRRRPGRRCRQCRPHRPRRPRAAGRCGWHYCRKGAGTGPTTGPAEPTPAEHRQVAIAHRRADPVRMRHGAAQRNHVEGGQLHGRGRPAQVAAGPRRERTDCTPGPSSDSIRLSSVHRRFRNKSQPGCHRLWILRHVRSGFEVRAGGT